MNARKRRVDPEEASGSGHDLREHAIVAVAPATGEKAVVRWYAKLIGGRLKTRIHVVRAPPVPEPFELKKMLSEEGDGMSGGRSMGTGKFPLGFLVATWEGSMDRLQSLMLQAAELDVPSVFVRQASLENIRRVLVATAWGPHTLHHMWLAKEIAAVLNVPLHVASMSHAGEHGSRHVSLVGPLPIVSMVDAQFEEWAKADGAIATDDCARGIANRLRCGDLLIMGVPSSFIVAEDFFQSIPASVARLTDAPLVLMRARQSGCPTLRDFFWGSLIQVNMRPKDKVGVIESLVDALIRHNQLPASRKSDLIQRAIKREQVVSTAVDRQTAFPHIRLPGFSGVAGALAICPDGVDFESPDGSLTKFVCLFVTPAGFCDEYLAVLAHIARRLTRPEIRAALLSCATRAEALHVLEPNSKTPMPRSI